MEEPELRVGGWEKEGRSRWLKRMESQVNRPRLCHFVGLTQTRPLPHSTRSDRHKLSKN